MNKVVIAALLAITLAGITSAAVMAFDEPTPPPYAGLKNPFRWDDATVQAQGKSVYTKSCLFCHGPGGGNLPQANFADPGFPAQLETGQDHFFWVVSEGSLSRGMPSFKSTSSDEQRWQVLTYLWSLGQSKTTSTPPAASSASSPVNPPAAPAITPPAPLPPVAPQAGKLTLNIAEQTYPPEKLMITAYLSEANGKPVPGQIVKFYLKKDFFTSDLMQVGELETDRLGMATLDYAVREDGDIPIVVRSANLETTTSWTLKGKVTPYRAQAGIRLPAIGPEISFGGTHEDLGNIDVTESPVGGIRLPGGTLSWLLLLVGVVLLIWSTYFRVLRQIFAIAWDAESTQSRSVKFVPIFGMVLVLFIGVVLALMILHGPYTHLELAR